MKSIYANQAYEKNIFMNSKIKMKKDYSSYKYPDKFETQQHCFAYISVCQKQLISVYGYGVVMQYWNGVERFKYEGKMREINMCEDLYELFSTVCGAIKKAVKKRMNKITIVYYNCPYETFLLGPDSLAESDIMIAKYYIEFLSYYRERIQIEFRRSCTPEDGMLITWADQIASGNYIELNYYRQR